MPIVVGQRQVYRKCKVILRNCDIVLVKDCVDVPGTGSTPGNTNLALENGIDGYWSAQGEHQGHSWKSNALGVIAEKALDIVGVLYP